MQRLTTTDLAATHGEPTPNFRRGAAVVTSEVTVTPRSSVQPASERTIKYLRDLVAERAPEVDPAFTESVIASGQKRCSAAIKRLLEMPQVACRWTPPVETPAPKAPVVPDGSYAIEREEGLRFYKVRTPAEGRWAGTTFVDVMASDELHKVTGQSRREVLAAIAEDPEAASIRFGQELGVCGRCGRTLTDEVSRAAGIGPVCATKGW